MRLNPEMTRKVLEMAESSTRAVMKPEKLASYACFNLPLAPSVNHYYRAVGSRIFISTAGRAYRKVVAAALALEPSFGGQRLSITLGIHPRNRWPIDIDNRIKVAADAMMHAGLFDDDSQIDHWSVDRCEIRKGGAMSVAVLAIGPGENP